MAVTEKEVNNIFTQEEPGNGLLSEEGVGKNGTDGTELGSEEVVSPAGQTLKAPVANPYPDLRAHVENYVAKNKKGNEAIVSVCYAKTGKRVTISVKQAHKLIGYGENEWLDVRYSDAAHTVLIGKAVEERGILPIFNEKKLIIYDVLTVKDFAETLCLDFSNCSSRSAYTCQMVQWAGRPYIALTPKDFD